MTQDTVAAAQCSADAQCCDAWQTRDLFGRWVNSRMGTPCCFRHRLWLASGTLVALPKDIMTLRNLCVVAATLSVALGCSDDDHDRLTTDGDASIEPDVEVDGCVDCDVEPDLEPDVESEVVVPNRAPALAPLADVTIAAGALYVRGVLATDPDVGDVLAYSLVTGPDELSLDGGSGALVWVPTAVGTYPVTVRVTDRAGLSDEAGFTFTVTGQRHGPVITAIADQRIAVPNTLDVALEGGDEDGDTLTWSLALAPTGMVIVDGALRWTTATTDVGAHDVIVEVTDPEGRSAADHFIVTVFTVGGVPVAKDDSYVAPRGVTTTIPASGILGNDSDPDGDALTATLVNGPEYGGLALRPDGSFDYRPGPPPGTPFEAVKAYHFDHLSPDGRDTFFRTTGGAVAGDLDGDGTIELVAAGHREDGFGNFGWLVAVRANPETHAFDLVWSTHTWGNANAVGRDELNVGSTPALGDLDGDGTLEVVAVSYCRDGIVIFNHDGTPRVTSGVIGCPGEQPKAALTLADIDNDGLPEILRLVRDGQPTIKLVAFDGDGSVLWESPVPDSRSYDDGQIVVADLDLDGEPEILTQRSVFHGDGTLVRTVPTAFLEGDDIRLAVANLNDDPFGEVVYTSARRGIEARTHDGVCIWRAHDGNAFADGCPTLALPDLAFAQNIVIADVDGDGAPEVIVPSASAGYASRITVLHRDGSLMWQTNPAIKGVFIINNDVAVFDFDNDGVMEVVTAGFGDRASDPAGVAFLDGKTGAPKLILEAGAEHPGGPGTGQGATRGLIKMFVADIDGDKSGELVIADEGYWDEGRTATGIFAYKSGNRPWAPTRPAWNQLNYMITNADRRGNVVAHPEPNWLVPGMNNFRVNVPLPEEAGGSDRFTYTASDGANVSPPAGTAGANTSNEATVVIEIRRANNPPAILGTPTDVVGFGETYHAVVRAVDSDIGDVVTLALESGPIGMTMIDGALYWETTEDDLGEHPVLVCATDLEGGIDTLAFVLRVVEPQPVPDLIAKPQAAATTAILAADFVLGRVTQAEHPTIVEGAVAFQNPAAGTMAVPGAAIAITVSLGPAPADRDDDGDTFTPNFGDCDDAAASVHPGAVDGDADGIDQDCDGIDGSVAVTSIVIEPGALALLIDDLAQLRAFGLLADGSAQEITAAVVWTATGAVTVSERGQVRATRAGAATVTATRGTVSASIAVEVVAFVADDIDPLAAIGTPVIGASVYGLTLIVGSASDANLVRYELSLAPAGDSVGAARFEVIATGTESVVNGTLGELDATTLMNGPYTLRLAVTDAGRNTSYDERVIVVDGEQKVGLFTLGFKDLTIPMGALSIDVTRTYDSRDKTRGDFGIGWGMAMSRMRVTCSTTLGLDWYSAKGGLSFQLLGERAHTCSVGLPDGSAETFDFLPTPPSSVLSPFLFLNAHFSPRNARGKLEALGNPYLIIVDSQPGPVTLLDDATFATYAPKRFRYIAPDETVFVIGEKGLESATDKNGNILTFSATGITHSAGTAIQTERDTLGRVTALTDALGQTQTYRYSAAGDLMSHTDALGNVTRFSYNRDHDLMRVEDPLGRVVIRNDYDLRGRLIATTDAQGRRTTYVHDDALRTRTTTFPDGSVQVVSYDERGNVIGRTSDVTIGDATVTSVEQFTFDAAGNITATVDADGVRTERAYVGDQVSESVIDPDGLAIMERTTFEGGQVTATIDPEGRTTSYDYDARGNANAVTLTNGATMRLTTDSQGRPAVVQTAGGERTELTYDGRGKVAKRQLIDREGKVLSHIEQDYDANGHVTVRRAIARDGDGDEVRTTRYAYDAAGRLLRTTDALAGETTIEYDAASQKTAIVENGRRTTMTWDASGNLATRTQADGAIEAFEYDYAGRLTKATDPFGVVMTYRYDELGRRLETRRDDVVQSAVTYTPAGRVQRVRDPDGVSDYEYDGAGRHVATYLPEVVVDGVRKRPTWHFEYDKSGRKTAEVDANGLRTETVYDPAGFPARIVYADGSAVAMAYDASGRLIARTDEDGDVSQLAYDGRGNITSIIEPAADASMPGAEMRVAYDGFGQLRARTDALGRTTSFSYDGLGRETRRVRPDGLAKWSDFDAQGNATRAGDFGGALVTSTWDALGRRTRRTADGLDESMTWLPGGLLATFSDARGTTTLEYEKGRLVGMIGPDGAELGYAYDDLGRVKRLDVQGESVDYAYDALGRLSEVRAPEGTTAYRYDLGGRLVETMLPNGVASSYTWDERNRIGALTLAKGGAEHQRYTATYSASGKRLTQTDGDGSESYGYDGVGRLVSANRTGSDPFALEFTHDLVGNRTRRVLNGIATTYDYGPNYELVSATSGTATTTYRYDARGNRIDSVASDGGGARSYTWDVLNRLASTTDEAGTPASAVAYGYDPMGQRVTRTEAGTSEHFLFDRQSVSGVPQVVESHDAGGETTAAWRFGHDAIAQARGGTTSFYGHDPHGNVRELSAANGDVTDRYGYLPHGGQNAVEGTTDNPIRGHGERLDSDLYDLRARAYDPATGTFLSRDPFAGYVDRPMSHHPYQYADQDPIGNVDPRGTETLVELSFVQSFTATLRKLDIGAKYKAFCAAKGTLDFLSYAVRAIDVAIYVNNIWDSGVIFKSRHLKTEFELPHESKFSIQVTPFAKDGSLGAEIAFELSQGGKKAGAAAKWYQGKWEVGVSAAAMLDVGMCGWTLAQVGIGVEHNTTTGSGAVNFLLEMSKDDENDRVESGGFKQPLFTW